MKISAFIAALVSADIGGSGHFYFTTKAEAIPQTYRKIHTETKSSILGWLGVKKSLI